MNISEMDLQVGRNALCDQIADKIEQTILSDRTQVQQKLPSEQTLASGFGVSRSVIREALMILKERGLVLPRQGGGSYITIPSSSQMMETVSRLALMRDISMEDVYAVRIQLEVMSARLAAEHATAEDLAKLEKINREMERYQGDVDQRVSLDLRFHLQIASSSKNQMLKIFIQSLNSLLTPLIRSTLVLPMASEDGVHFHDRIIAALRAGDADASENIMREHMVLFARNSELVAPVGLMEEE